MMSSTDKSKARISGLTFKNVVNIRHAVSHAERTELCEASYLLKPQDRLANCVVYGGGRENEITELFYSCEAALSRQAKRAGASPFWEGVAVLPALEEFESVEAYHAVMSERLMSFKGEFEKATGCSVLLMSIHLDEGYKDPETGIVSRNPHAHILTNRMVTADRDRKPRKEAKRKRETDPDRRVLWKPDSSTLARIQTLCAETLEMKRGSTVQERGGKPARKNIDHKQWREMQGMAKAREAELAVSAEVKLSAVRSELTALEQYKAKLVDTANTQITKFMAEAEKLPALRAELTALQQQKAELAANAEAMIGAKQSEIAALMQRNAELTANVNVQIVQLKAEAEKLPALRAEIASLKAQAAAHAANAQQGEVEAGKAAYAAVRAFLKGTGKAKQSDYQSLKKLHESGHGVIQSWANFIDKTDDAQLDQEEMFWVIRGHELSVLNELREPVSNGVSGGETGRLQQESDEFVQPLKLWKLEDEDLYLLPEKNEAGRRLAFVDQGDKINVQMADDYDVVLKAMKLSAVKWPKGFELQGSPEFLQMAMQACADLDVQNYAIKGPSAPGGFEIR